VEIAAGAQWIGPVTFDSVPADETTFGGGTRPLFDTRSRLDPSIGVAATVGLRVASAFQLEGNFAYGATHLTTHVTGDQEGIPDVSADSSVTQYLLGGDLLLQLARWRTHRIAPFIIGGASYLRQLNEGRTLVQTGTAFSAGGGVYYSHDVKSGRVKSTGLRLDVRALAIRDAVVLDGRTHVTAAVTASLFARF
jgi:hypothetical protein